MTARADWLGIGTLPSSEQRGWMRSPREGWWSLVLLALMGIALGVAIDEANWAGLAPRGGQQTSFLPLTTVVAVLVGFLVAKSRLPTFTAHVVGSIAAAAFLLVSVANAMSASAALTSRLRDLNESIAIFYQDAIVLGIRSAETSAFLLIIGAIVWGVAYFAAFNLFRRGRAMPGVIAIGLALLINMSVTVRIQYIYLIVFAGAAMLLLVRMNLLAQHDGWRRRRIGDAPEASSLFMRGGSVFVALTLMGSIFLAATASSAPLANAWRNMDDQLLSIGAELNRFIGGVTGAARGPSGLFGSSQTIAGVWDSTSEPVFRHTSSDGLAYYWRGATYDRFDGFTWQQLDRLRTDVTAGQELLATSSDQPAGLPGTRAVEFTVTSINLAGGALISPSTPVTIDRDAAVTLSGEGGPMASIDLRDAIDPGEGYTVLALVPEGDEDSGAITAAELASAGVQYPAWAQRYVEITEGSISPLVKETTDRIVGDLPADERDPYHVANAVQDFLYDTGDFTYSTNVLGLCGREKVVECFLRTRQGYCEHFATTMVMMLRTQLIPTRLAMGFLPGREVGDATWEVDRSAAHAWVEVYFPTYGWMKFDPTPGNAENGQEPTALDPGVSEPGSSPGPRATPGFVTEPIDPGVIPPGGGRIQSGNPGGGGGNGPDLGPLAIVAVGVLAAVVLALIVLARRRRLSYTEPEVAYRGVARLAGRFGYGPKPTQTAYEFAGSLSEVVPSVRVELGMVAKAKVESTYARRDPSADMRAQLRAAYRRIRVGLLRLLFRRGRGPSRSGPRSLDGP